MLQVEKVDLHYGAAIALRQKPFLWWWAALLLVVPWVGAMLLGIARVFISGPGVYGLDWPAMWGFDIIDYVWWIGIASGGTLISSLFFITRATWRSAISRIAGSLTTILF